MRKGFTLVEMMVVVMVIAILMAIVVRFGNIGADAQARNKTISRMQRLENCISGYYAAYGTYPPVALQASRNIYLSVDGHGLQSDTGDQNSSIWGWIGSDGKVKDATGERRAWEQVQAACQAQPMTARFPYADEYAPMVEAESELMKAYAEQAPEEELSPERRAVFLAGFDHCKNPMGRFSGGQRAATEWGQIQLFQFGLMSYLLPRYMFMMLGPSQLFQGGFAQWTKNNDLPCDPLFGSPYTGGWLQLRNDANGNDLTKVANVPSQAVCARWMPNLETSLRCSRHHSFFGVNVTEELDSDSIEGLQINKYLTVYAPNRGSTANQYLLDCITILDGWGSEFYYYSPAPYQSYVIWSAGPNGRTFPPWVSRESLGSQASACVSYWTKDDLIHLSH